MSVFVVDASVAAKWFFNEEDAVNALSVLHEGNQLHAPDFLRLEMDSILCKWVRRGTVGAADARDIRDTFRRYPIEYHPFASLQDSAYAIATQAGRSVYDCLYVALAALLKAKMVTADRRLHDALKDGPFKRHVVWVGDVS